MSARRSQPPRSLPVADNAGRTTGGLIGRHEDVGNERAARVDPGGKSLIQRSLSEPPERGFRSHRSPYGKISWGCARVTPGDGAIYAFVSDDGERSTPGKGLVQGLAVTFKTMTKPSVTQQYP